MSVSFNHIEASNPEMMRATSVRHLRISRLMACETLKDFQNITSYAAVSLFTLHYLTTIMRRPLFDSFALDSTPKK
jgi:hypothetical protein